MGIWRVRATQIELNFAGYGRGRAEIPCAGRTNWFGFDLVAKKCCCILMVWEFNISLYKKRPLYMKDERIKIFSLITVQIKKMGAVLNSQIYVHYPPVNNMQIYICSPL